MKYELINPIKYNTAIEQILFNRGIASQDFYTYMYSTDDVINEPSALGEKILHRAARCLMQHIHDEHKILVVVDADCDGFTSAALFINYLHNLFPALVENYVFYVVHEGKQHGLGDIDFDYMTEFDLIVVPDAGSNDYDQHAKLKEKGVDVIVLDHHEADHISEDAIVINNQLCDYPNKMMSGVGIVWQFCRYIDIIAQVDYANNYLDLVALGMDADVMNMRSLETKHLIQKGLKLIRNPFILAMTEKNNFSLKGKVTPMGAAFYIAPYVNAIVRSGTIEEKLLVFESMLEFRSYKQILSTKRGHKLGEMETIVDQAIRTATNVKKRQTIAQDKSMAILEEKITKENLLDYKVLLFLLEPEQIESNIAGLVANKIMGKYNRPCCVLTLNPNTNIYQGSARGCDKVGITHFKDLCEQTGYSEYAVGHQSAFGLAIKKENINNFINKMEELLKDVNLINFYQVDFIYEGKTINPNVILEIGSLENFWGSGFEEAKIAIKGLKVIPQMVTLMSRDKNPTLKISIPDSRINLLKFKSSEEEYENLTQFAQGYLILDIVGTCQINEWMGNVTPQIFIQEYEIVSSSKYNF